MACNHQAPWSSPLTPSLARRLAEAADGFRNKNKQFFLVAELKPDSHGAHAVRGPFEKSQDLPQELCDLITAGLHGWFGPFEAEGPSDTTLLIDEMDIRLKTRDAKDKRSLDKFAARRFDCLVWSRSALEKFLVPYYARMYGGAYVQELVTRFEADQMLLVGHLPGTEYENPDQPPPPTEAEEVTLRPQLGPGIAAVIRLASQEGTPGVNPPIDALVPSSKEPRWVKLI